MAASTTSEWSNLATAIKKRGLLPKFNDVLSTDEQHLAFCRSRAITEPVTFGIKMSGAHDTLLVTTSYGKSSAKV